ncbi:MAG TPA: hypothetical protein VEL28_08425 [Candidatus Binatia bacterium]|nr:hypothetical protein [Candidatus Binatia bacterium]
MLFSEVLAFSKAVSSNFFGVVGAIDVVLLVIALIFGWELPRKVFAALLVPLVLVAFFQAWKFEKDRADDYQEQLTSERNRPASKRLAELEAAFARIARPRTLSADAIAKLKSRLALLPRPDHVEIGGSLSESETLIAQLWDVFDGLGWKPYRAHGLPDFSGIKVSGGLNDCTAVDETVALLKDERLQVVKGDCEPVNLAVDMQRLYIWIGMPDPTFNPSSLDTE